MSSKARAPGNRAEGRDQLDNGPPQKYTCVAVCRVERAISVDPEVDFGFDFMIVDLDFLEAATPPSGLLPSLEEMCLEEARVFGAMLLTWVF